MRYNPKDADDGGFTVPEGVYDAELVCAEDAVTKAGDPMLIITYRVNSDGKDKTFRQWFTSNPIGLGQLKRMCAATGLPYDEGEIDPTTIHGQACKIHVKVESKGGYTNNRVTKWESLNGSPAAPAKDTNTYKPGEGDAIPF